MTDWGELVGISFHPIICGILLLSIATTVAWSYSFGLSGVRIYENLMRLFVAIMLLTVLVVVIQTGVNWGKLVRGLLTPTLPDDREGLTIVLGGMGASVYTTEPTTWVQKNHKGEKHCFGMQRWGSQSSS